MNHPFKVGDKVRHSQLYKQRARDAYKPNKTWTVLKVGFSNWDSQPTIGVDDGKDDDYWLSWVFELAERKKTGFGLFLEKHGL